MVPEGWKRESLSDVTAVIDCKHRTPVYVEAGIPLVSPGTIKWGALDLVSPVKRVSQDEYESLMDHCSVEIGDLVMSRNQSIGIASYVDSDEPFVLGQDTVLIKPFEVDSKFVFYKLQSEVVQRSIVKLAGGSTFSRINLADIRKLKLNLPPLPEQKKIAQILSTWDKAITTTEQLLANSQQQKKALMQQLLTGKKRLLDENGVRFEGEWKDHFLGEIVEITTSGSKSAFVSESGHNFIIDMGSVSREGKLIPSKRTTLESDFLEVGQLVMPKDDIGGGNIIGRVGLILEANKYVLADHVYAMKVLKHDSVFIGYLINSNKVNKSLRRRANGTAQLGLGKKDVEKQVLHMPASVVEQQKIAAVLSTADQEISALQQKIDALKQEKKALMQQLLTGKRRVQIN